MPFRDGEEVHVDIVEPHMYPRTTRWPRSTATSSRSRTAIPYVGEKRLVRIEQAGRTAARAVLVERGRRRPRRPPRSGARRASARPSAPRAAPARADAPPAHAGDAARSEAVEALAEDGAGPRRHRARRRRPRPTRTRRSRAGGGARGARPSAEVAAAERPSGGAEAARRGDGEPRADATESAEASDDDAVQSKPRRRGRRGGRRRSRAKADADAAEVSEASE